MAGLLLPGHHSEVPSGSAGLREPTFVPGWERRTVSPAPVGDHRLRRQDLAWMGADRFVAAWVSGGSPGQLLVRKFNVTGNWESGTRVLQEHVLGVQALASDPINLGPCVAKPA